MLLEKVERCPLPVTVRPCATLVYTFGHVWQRRLIGRTQQPMSAPPPPTPLAQHILRSHSSPISALSVSGDNERIYSGDASGKVVVTSTGSLRAITQWNAHTDSILGVEEWDDHIVMYVCDFYCPTLLG
jgi:hypothetical protein